MIFPRKAHLLFANLLGFLFLISGNKRNKYSKINIEMCFPELSQQERSAIYRKNIISSGKVLFDTGSPCFFSSLRLEEKGLSTENRLFNCKDIDEAKVIPLYAGPNIKSKFNSLCCM